MSLRVALLLSVAACGVSNDESTQTVAPEVSQDVAGAPPHGDQPTWTIDQTSEQGALLGVWGTSPDDVWAVGGTATEPLVLHYDGASWSRVPVPGQARLWNVYGFGIADVYAVGEHGLVLHFDGHEWAISSSGTDATLYGLWGASGEDVWLAGGSVIDPAGSATLLRGTGAEFHPVADLPDALRPSALFKVHGFDPTDVLVAGTSGMLHYDGATWMQEPVPSSEPLHSTWGSGPDDIYAVGGRDYAEIVHYDGNAWSVVDLGIGTSLAGVFVSSDGSAYAVGPSGWVIEIGADGRLSQAALPDLGPSLYLHGVWGDEAGTTYVVGGALQGVQDPLAGVILRRH